VSVSSPNARPVRLCRDRASSQYGVEVLDVDASVTRVVEGAGAGAGAEPPLNRMRLEQAANARVAGALQERLVEVKKEQGGEMATRTLELRACVDFRKVEAAVKETCRGEVREEQRLEEREGERGEKRDGRGADRAWRGWTRGRHGVLWDRTTQRRNQRGPRSVFGVQTTPVS
jgi:hypothetical protein